MPAIAAFQCQHPAGQRLVIHPLEAFQDRLIHQPLWKPFGRQFSPKLFVSHRAAYERGLKPSNRIRTIIKIVQRGQAGNDQTDICR